MTNAQLHAAQLKILKLTPDVDGLSASEISKGSGFATFAALNRLSQLEALGMVDRIPTDGASLWRRTEVGRQIAYQDAVQRFEDAIEKAGIQTKIEPDPDDYDDGVIIEIHP